MHNIMLFPSGRPIGYVETMSMPNLFITYSCYMHTILTLLIHFLPYRYQFLYLLTKYQMLGSNLDMSSIPKHKKDQQLEQTIICLTDLANLKKLKPFKANPKFKGLACLIKHKEKGCKEKNAICMNLSDISWKEQLATHKQEDSNSIQAKENCHSKF